MWHEARKQEKKIRGMMVDYKRRAERRRDYYERIKQDPAQFLQVHGRPAKIHLDPAVAAAADSPATMMPWQGNPHNMIDRFDVRAHLDIIPDYTSPAEPPKLCGEEDRKACYERYRTLVQNDFMGVNEDKFLHQIFLEERFGPVLKPAGEEEKKKLMDKKAAIGYVYEDSTPAPLEIPPTLLSNPVLKMMEEEEDEDEKDDLSDIDLDITVDVSELSVPQCAEMNEHSHKYGMVDDDFITYLLQDKEEADQLRLVKEIEEEKAMFSGRKSRRERRALREKKLAGRKITSPPSYAARDSPTYTPMRHSTSKSRSRSRTPPNSGKITFITSFGDEVSDPEKRSSGQKSSKEALHKKNSSKDTRPSKNSSAVVIGPQLPERSSSHKKSHHRSSRRRSSSSSSSGTSSRRDRSSKRDSKRHSSSSRHKSGRSRRSSSSRSPTRSSSRSRNKKKSTRKSSRSRDSRSRSASSRSRSRSSPQQQKNTGKSRSRSRSHSVRKSASPNLPPPPVKSYYRHSLSRSSSDLDTEDSDSPEQKEDSSSGINTGPSLTTKVQQLTGKAGPTTKSKLTPQERLKRKMQLALNKQYKADKRAQMEKTEKLLQERMDRAEELREMAIKLRQRERERRHRLRGYDRESESDSSLSKADLNSRDEAYPYPKEHRAQSPSSDSSDDRGYSKRDDIKLSREQNSRGTPHHSSHQSSSRDQKWGSSSDQFHKKSESRHSPTRWSPRKSPPRSRKSPPRSSRQRSPHKYSSGSRDDRYSDSRRQSSRSPYRHSSSRRDRRSRSPQYQSRQRNSRPLVEY